MTKDLQEIVSNFEGKKILVIGDIMLDVNVLGNVKRVSPEAAALVLKEESRKYMLGGAANVAANIASLSGTPTLLGFIGQDPAGQKLVELAEEARINLRPTYQGNTIVKTRFISTDHQPQQILRSDREETTPKFLESNLIMQEAEKAELVVVSDYAKGAVTPELIQTLLQTRKRVLVDPKQKKEIYQGVYLLKPNEAEALKMSGLNNVEDAGKFLRQAIQAKAVIITRGAKGMTLFTEESTINIPTYAKEVYDVTGAGDTVMSVLALALATGASLYQSPILANHAAGIAVAHPGTYRVRNSELLEILDQESGKIKTLDELERIVRNYHEKGKKVVWTNGCFDILHDGHIDYLKKARQEGDCLIVGLNSDSSVRKLKGAGRPLQSEESRAKVLSSLEFVNYVLIFPETSVERYLKALQPDIYAKGSDYSLTKMNQTERATLESYGGKAVFVPLTPGKSSTEIIKRIKNSS